ncbi:MAG: hypothetical protein ACHQ2F_00520 [Desulfobaccales bacterium]
MVMLVLSRRHLFHYRSAGFWAWCAVSLYFLVTPAIQLNGDLSYLETRLALTEGLPRMEWVTLCVAMGIAVFFLAYFVTKPGHPNFGLTQETWPTGTWIIIILAMLSAAYSLIIFRGAFGYETPAYTIVNGRYVQGDTGYGTVMHTFALFPIVLLFSRRSTRLLGVALVGLFIWGRLEDTMDRATSVSLLLAISIADTYRRRRRWPHWAFIVIALLFTLFIQARGHTGFAQFRESGRSIVSASEEEVARGEGAVMLSTLYLKTYLADNGGYTYGLNIISQSLFGALPRKYFPWKSWLEDEYGKVDLSQVYGSEFLTGAKHTVIGDLYGCGSIIAIIIGMPILGFLTRKLDGFLSPQSPMLVRTMGICWASTLWLSFGSGVSWAFCQVYLYAVPFVAIVLLTYVLSPKTTHRGVRVLAR